MGETSELPKISRREFIKRVAGTAVGLALAGLPRGSQAPLPTESQEREKKPNTKTLVIDVTPETFANLDRHGPPLCLNKNWQKN